MKTTALAPWFGSNRMLAEEVGKLLRGCKWVGVPFAGGMSELVHIKATTIVVSDLHRHVINLAMVVADPELRPKLIASATDQAFHPDALAKAQGKCKVAEHEHWISSHGNLEWAVNYFIAVWQGRSAKAGTKDEFKGGLPVRWSASGGDSNTRYRSAIASLDAWGVIMRSCNFVVQDVFEFLGNVKDLQGHGLYLDPPFPGPGDDYKHKFTEAQHVKLASRLAEFKSTRVVCRFYDHSLIRELYPEGKWRWHRLAGGRTQANKEAPEVLIVNQPD
jgi:DNA adenine methylase